MNYYRTTTEAPAMSAEEFGRLHRVWHRERAMELVGLDPDYEPDCNMMICQAIDYAKRERDFGREIRGGDIVWSYCEAIHEDHHMLMAECWAEERAAQKLSFARRIRKALLYPLWI